MRAPLHQAPHIDGVQWDEHLTAVVHRLGMLLSRHGLTSMFEATVRHVHFPISQHEAVLLLPDAARTRQGAHVVPVRQVNERMAVTWDFTPDGATAIATRWCAVCNNSAKLAIINRGLMLIGTFLADEQAVALLSVQLAHNHLLVPAGFGLLETTNEDDRTQLTVVIPADGMPADRPATWAFDVFGKPVPRGWCSSSNNGVGGYHNP